MRRHLDDERQRAGAARLAGCVAAENRSPIKFARVPLDQIASRAATVIPTSKVLIARLPRNHATSYEPLIGQAGGRSPRHPFLT
jgi:hypothetical protein